MAKRRGPPESGEVAINMTPMIDCTFLLIIFFIVAGQISSQELAKLILPAPHESQARKKKDEKNIANRMIVNVVSRAGHKKDRDRSLATHAECYKVGLMVIPLHEVDRLGALLKKAAVEKKKAGVDEFFVEIRADRDIEWSYVKPVMDVAARQGLTNMSIAAITAMPKAGEE